MLFLNLRIPRMRIVAVLLGIIAVFTAAVVISLERAESEPEAEAVLSDGFSAEEYITSFGPTVNASECKVDEITVPTEFGDVYASYNEIQKSQGFDLERYKGMTLTRYTYPVTNYPDSNASVFAEVLMYDGKVVAADIYSTDSDGFIRALK